MPRPKLNLIKVTMNFDQADYERLRQLHPGTPVAEVMRMICRAYVAAVDTKSALILDDIMKLP